MAVPQTSLWPPSVLLDQVRERPEAHLVEGGPEGGPYGLADPQDLPEGQMSRVPPPCAAEPL